MTTDSDTGSPLLVAIDMGYGHLRPAHALAERLGVPVCEVDRPPLCSPTEQRAWRQTRRLYEVATRASQSSWFGSPLRSLLDGITHIPPLYPNRDLSAVTGPVRLLAGFIGRGLGRGMLETLRRNPRPLLTTFFAPAIIADRRVETPVYCVVTDADINRVWVPHQATGTSIQYLVPSRRAGRRLRAYGVADSRITVTGFPLPHELLGGPELTTARQNLAARLARLDPRGTFRDELGAAVEQRLGLPLGVATRPPLLTFAVGGTGTQAELVRRMLPSLRPLLEQGRLHLALVAGLHAALERQFNNWLAQAGLAGLVGRGVEILVAPDFASYYLAFNALLARTDILWTKPSEMTFYGALGLPLVFTRPVGMHERYNRRWAIEQGAGVRQHAPDYAGEWLSDWLEDGTLAGVAWSGFVRLPKQGLYRIAELVAAARSSGRPH